MNDDYQKTANSVVAYLLSLHDVVAGEGLSVHIVMPPYGTALKIEVTLLLPYPHDLNGFVLFVRECQMSVRRKLGEETPIYSIGDLNEHLKWLTE